MGLVVIVYLCWIEFETSVIKVTLVVQWSVATTLRFELELHGYYFCKSGCCRSDVTLKHCAKEVFIFFMSDTAKELKKPLTFVWLT